MEFLEALNGNFVLVWDSSTVHIQDPSLNNELIITRQPLKSRKH